MPITMISCTASEIVENENGFVVCPIRIDWCSVVRATTYYATSFVVYLAFIMLYVSFTYLFVAQVFWVCSREVKGLHV